MRWLVKDFKSKLRETGEIFKIKHLKTPPIYKHQKSQTYANKMIF